MNRPRTPIKRLAPFFPALAPHFEVVLLRDLEQKLRAHRIVAGTNETDVRMKKLFRADVFDIAIRSGRKELRREAECYPFRVEARHEKSLRQLPHRDDVRDFRPISALVPLRVVVPHRVRPALENRAHRVEIEAVALAEDHEVGLESPRLRERPTLRELSADQAAGALVVDQERLVTVALQRTLGALLHPPPLIAADHQDSHASADPQRSGRTDLSHSRAYFAMTLAAARQARMTPRAPSRNPPFNKYMPTNLAGGLKTTAAAVPRR